MNKIDMRADKTAVRADKEENPSLCPVGLDHDDPKKCSDCPDDLPDYLREKEERVPGWVRVMVEEEFHKLGVPEDRSRYFKNIMRYTMGCPEDGCDGEGRYDDRGEVVCPECGLVISHRPDEDKSFAGTIYADKYCQGSANEAGHRNRSGSGDPNMRTPALRDPGPENDVDFGRD